MKKVLLFILLIIVLVGCNAYNDVTTNTPIENSSSNETESMSIEVNEVELKMMKLKRGHSIMKSNR